MIENIYSNENGDINQTSRVQPNFKMPKNIRQVGKTSANKKIYVEDYVMTYIKQLTGEDYSKCKIAVLVGQYAKIENVRNIFISGAIEVEGVDTTSEINFSNESWTEIYEKIKKYFVEAEIIGWFIGGPGYLLEDMDKITKAHVNNFAGQDKALLTYDNMEKEETFLLYENKQLTKQEGFYIYYEKNDEMQTYMIDRKKTPSSEEASYDDKVSREIRTVLQSKRPTVQENKSVNRLMYAAGTLLAVIVLVVGAAMLGNYDQMKNMQNALDSLSKNLENVENIFAGNHSATPTSNEVKDPNMIITDENQEGQQGSLDVEVVPGNVSPVEEDDDDRDRSPSEELAEDDQQEDTEQLDHSDEPNTDESNSQEETSQGQGSKDPEDKKPEEEPSSTTEEEPTYYIVKEGDSLIGICFKLYNSANYMDEIMAMNNIQDEDYIYVGQRLRVP